jgi:hypothetical protein
MKPALLRPDRRRSTILAMLGGLLTVTLGPRTAFPRPPSARLPRLAGWEETLNDAGRAGEPVIILWGTPGCPWCDALRADVLVHVWREAAQRGIRIYELDLTDARPLEGAPTLTPADLAARLKIRVSPTVSFHGPGGEIAPRLVGYPSRDFYLSYLEDRMQQARNKLRPSTPSSHPEKSSIVR